MLHTHTHTHTPRITIEANCVAKTWWKPLRNHVQRYPFAVHQPLNYLHFVWKITKNFVHIEMLRSSADDGENVERFGLYIVVHASNTDDVFYSIHYYYYYFETFSLFYCCHRLDARCGPSASLFLYSIDFSLFPNGKNGNPNQQKKNRKTTRSLWPRRNGEKKFGVCVLHDLRCRREERKTNSAMRDASE